MEPALERGKSCRLHSHQGRFALLRSGAGGSMTLLLAHEPRRRVPIWHGTFLATFLCCYGVLQAGGSPGCADCFCGQACPELTAVDTTSLSCADFRAKLLLKFFPEPGCNNTFFGDQKKLLEARCGKGPAQQKHQCNFARGLSVPEETVSAIALVFTFLSIVINLESHHD